MKGWRSLWMVSPPCLKVVAECLCFKCKQCHSKFWFDAVWWCNGVHRGSAVQSLCTSCESKTLQTSNRKLLRNDFPFFVCFWTRAAKSHCAWVKKPRDGADYGGKLDIEMMQLFVFLTTFSFTARKWQTAQTENVPNVKRFAKEHVN